MATLMLSVPIEVTIKDGKKKEKLSVEMRDFTKAEQKEAEKLFKKFKEISFRSDSISTKLESVKKKAGYAEKLDDFNKAMEYQEKADTLQEELESLLKELEKIGGDDFYEKQAKKNFERIVSGEGKERLAEIAETKGYTTVMKLLGEAKREVEGKPQGA